MFTQVAVILAVAAVALASPLVVDGRIVSIEGRIVGGAGVNLGQVPSVVSLRPFGINFHYCGGAILSNRWVVTAGSCTAGRVLNGINVVIGTVTLATGGVTHRSQNITVHPGFDPVTLANDISLIYTATVMAFNANAQIVALSPNIIGPGASVEIIGWGSSLQSGGASPNNLQRLFSTTITNADCRSRHDVVNAHRVTDTKFCVFTRTAEGTCFGDEGAPVIVGGILVGIVSWQTPCATGLPDVFERMSSHRVWITSILQ